MPHRKNQNLTSGKLFCCRGVFREWSYFIAGLFFLFSCSEKQPQSQPTGTKTDSLARPQITYLADLPDSLQPKVTYLEHGPKPVTKIFSIPTPTKTFIDKATGLLLPPEVHGEGFFTSLTTEDGLASDYVHTTYIDKAGHLWIGTRGGGAARYDGESFTTFTTEHGLVGNYVWGINEDSKGHIWFTTFAGVSMYDGRTFTSFTMEQGLPFNDVGKMLEDNEGHLWFTTIGGGVSRFDGKSFINYNETHGLTNKYIFGITKDKKGGLWFGTRGGGVFRLQNPSADTLTFVRFEGLPEWKNDIVYCMHEDRKGNMWFGMQYSGLFSFDGKTIKKYSGADGLDCKTINDIMEDREGNMWFATCKGLSKLSDSIFITYANEFDLEDKTVSGISQDRFGSIWFGTGGGGVFRYDGKAITKFTDDPINTNVSFITEDHAGYIWFATNNQGLSRYDGKNLITFSTDHGIARNNISFITEDRSQRIWFSTYYGGGVGCLDFNIAGEMSSAPLSTSSFSPTQNQSGLVSLTTYTTLQGLPFDAVYDIKEDISGNLWFSTYGGGVSRFDGKSFTTFTKQHGLASNEVFRIYEDSKANLWFLYSGTDGITFFDGKSFTNFTIESGLPNMGVWSMTEDKSGNLWFGSENGLILLREEEVLELSKKKTDKEFTNTPTFETFTTQQGLPNNCINDLVSDHNGNVMISTNMGFVVLQGGLSAFSTPGAIQTYSPHEGYPLRSISGIHVDKNGVIWLATNSEKTGLVRLDPNAIHKSMDPPELIIKSIKINNEAVNWYGLSSSLPSQVKPDSNATPAHITEELMTFSRELNESDRDSLRMKFDDIRFDSIAKWYPVPINLVLPYRHNSLTIDFNAMVTSRNNLVQYQYMLEGYDTDWSPPVTNSSSTFGNINEGQYTFKVKARSPDGVWSEPTTYYFSVLPPLHRTWWAYSLYGLMFFGLIISGHRYQKQRTISTERKKAEQKQAILNERLRISRDLHDEVGATLSGISMYSHLAKEQIKIEHQNELLNSLTIMQESSGDMVNKLNDIVWLLNPDQAQLHQLVEKLEAYARQMAEINTIKVTVEISDNIAEIELPLEVRRNVYLIFKEAINNSIKYSQATTLNLSVMDFDHTLEVTIHDNGIGFDPEMIKKGNGLDNMKKRAEEIGALLHLKSSPGKGTRLSLVYKLPLGRG